MFQLLLCHQPGIAKALKFKIISLGFPVGLLKIFITPFISSPFASFMLILLRLCHCPVTVQSLVVRNSEKLLMHQLFHHIELDLVKDHQCHCHAQLSMIIELHQLILLVSPGILHHKLNNSQSFSKTSKNVFLVHIRIRVNLLFSKFWLLIYDFSVTKLFL